jgi:hypothetical protein
MTGYELWWYSTVCSVIQLQKYDFLSKISNSRSRKQLGFYNFSSGLAQIGARCLIKNQIQVRRSSNRSTICSHRTPIFYEAKASILAPEIGLRCQNRSTILCFTPASKLTFSSFKIMPKHLNSTRIT